MYQCCSEVAFWNIAQPSVAAATRSQWLNATYFEAQCAAIYGAAVFPDTAAFNKKWGGATPPVGASRVFATQGSDDPWQSAGVQKPLSQTYRESTATCAGCSHCRDLSGSRADDPAALAATRKEVMAAVAGWVKGQ